jgi:hypothetical protein
MFLKIKTVCLHVIIPEMPSFSMRPAKYFYDNPLPKYLDPKTVLIYRPHPVYLWVFFALQDLDPATPINADPCESGSTNLVFIF